MNSTEWEITVHLHDFDEFWMRYAAGRSSDIVIFNSHFQDVISISEFSEILISFNSEIGSFHYSENSQFLRHGVLHSNEAFNTTELQEAETLEFTAFFS